MSDQDTNAAWRNEELLRQKYWGEEKSTTTIADEFDCTDGTISKWLNRFDIETRGVDGFSKDAPWKDKQTLRKLYVEDEMAIEDIADKFDCSPQPIRTWLEKFDIDVSANDPDAKYRDGELLEELYWSKGLSTVEISERLDCSKHSVQNWMERHGIQTRKSNHDKVPTFHTDKEGYEAIHIGIDYETYQFPIHRLVAVAEGGLPPDKLKGRKLNVHHKNGIPWDNRPENLEVLDHAKHAQVHSKHRDRDEGRFD